MKSEEQLEEVHDFLNDLIDDPVIFPELPAEIQDGAKITRDCLCFVLDHGDRAKTVEGNLENLRNIVANIGNYRKSYLN